MRTVNGVQLDNGDIAEQMVNQYSGTAIIVGSAACVWDDLDRARAIAKNHDLICINLSFCAFKYQVQKNQIHVEHWIGLQPEILYMRHQYAGDRVKTHSYYPGPGVDYVWQGIGAQGTSGLFATRIALAMGYKKVILTGIPLDAQLHFHDYPRVGNCNWALDRHLSIAWEKSVQEEFQGRVRSMSGRTKGWLGEPTEDWLHA